VRRFDLVSGANFAGSCRRRSAPAAFLAGWQEPRRRSSSPEAAFRFPFESEPGALAASTTWRATRRQAAHAIRIITDGGRQDASENSNTGRANTSLASVEIRRRGYEAAAKYPHLSSRGADAHRLAADFRGPFVEAVEKVSPFARQLKKLYGHLLLSIGGGIGIVYQDALASGEAAWWNAQAGGERRSPRGLRAALQPLLAPLGLKILLEPGRSSWAMPACSFPASSILKRGSGRNFSCSTRRMNDLVRPAMYEAYHEAGAAVARHLATRAGSRHRRSHLRVGRLFCQGSHAADGGEGELVASWRGPTVTPWPAVQHPAHARGGAGSAAGSSWSTRARIFACMVAGEKTPVSQT